MKPVRKTQFAGLNDKRYYLHDGIVSLPFGNFLLENVRKEKEKYRTKTKHWSKKKMYKFLELEGKSVHFCEGLIIKKYKRFNNQWKLEIIKFKTPNLEEIY